MHELNFGPGFQLTHVKQKDHIWFNVFPSTVCDEEKVLACIAVLLRHANSHALGMSLTIWLVISRSHA